MSEPTLAEVVELHKGITDELNRRHDAIAEENAKLKAELEQMKALVASYDRQDELIGTEFEGVDEVTDVIRLLKQERAQAQRACAEMRDICVRIVAWYESPIDAIPSAEALTKLSHDSERALSSDCGKDYVHRSEVERLREALNKVSGYGRGDMGAQQLADYVTEVANEALETKEAR